MATARAGSPMHSPLDVCIAFATSGVGGRWCRGDRAWLHCGFDLLNQSTDDTWHGVDVSYEIDEHNAGESFGWTNIGRKYCWR